MQERKSYSQEFKLRAASMVLDDSCSITEVCISLEVGSTALRRWVDQVRRERQGKSVGGTRAIIEDRREVHELKARIKQLETETEILKKATALLLLDPGHFR